jgi:hypothetical protein
MTDSWSSQQQRLVRRPDWGWSRAWVASSSPPTPQQTFLLRSRNIDGTRWVLQNIQMGIQHFILNFYRSVRCKQISTKVF